jgi:hypothetical protein
VEMVEFEKDSVVSQIITNRLFQLKNNGNYETRRGRPRKTGKVSRVTI